MLKNYALLILLGLVFTFSACKEDETVPKSSAKAITKLTFPQFTPAIQATIDEATKRITAVVPPTADVTKLIPSISVSLKAKVLPDSGKVQDFTNDVTYTVTAEDGTKQDYKVMVSRTKFSGKDILSFTFADFSPVIAAKIDPATKTITATVPATADLTKLKPTITLSDRATVNPASVTVVDFTKPVNFTVTAEDAGTQVYAVTVVKEVATNNLSGTVFYAGLYGEVLGFDTKTGTQNWKWTAPSINNIEACSSPTIDNNVMYIGIGSQFFAIDIKTQKTIWTYPKSGFASRKFYNCPVIANGIIYTDNGRNLVAIDASNGTLLWSVSLGNLTLSSPTFLNDIIYIGSDDGNIYAMDKTGKEKWKYSIYPPNLGSSFLDIEGNPTIQNNILYANPSSSDGFATAIDIQKGTKLWNVSAGSAFSTASPTVVNNIVYFYLTSSEILTAFDAKTGNKLWESNAFRNSGSPMVVNGTIYFANSTVKALDAKTGVAKSGFSTSQSSGTPVLVVDKTIFISNNRQAKAIDSQTGSLLWVSSVSMNFSGTTPIVLTNDGKVYHGGVSGATD